LNIFADNTRLLAKLVSTAQGKFATLCPTGLSCSRPFVFMFSSSIHSACLNGAALLKRLGCCALVVAVLGCSGCAWFKSKEPADSPDINLREEPKEGRFRPKREDGKHLYGGVSPEANAIERSLGY
jgi:hypothetical protein